MRPYPFPVPFAVSLSLGKLHSALQQNLLYYSRGETRYELVVKDLVLGTRLSLFFREHSEVRGRKLYHKRFSKRVRVKVYVTRAVFGSVVTVSSSIPFRLTKNSVEILDFETVLSRLSFKLSRAARHRSRGWRTQVSRVKATRANPETVIGSVPKFRVDGGTYTNQGFDSVLVYNRDWSGVRTPGYPVLARLRKLPVNPHSVSMVRRHDSGSLDQQEVLDNPNFSVMKFDSYTTHLGTKDYGPAKGISHITNHRNKAIDRLADAVRGETSNLSETLATFGKTVDMISNTVGRITGSISSLKRGNIPAAASILFHGKPRYRRGKGNQPSLSKSLAQNWLELQYGWKPLLKDIEYSVKALGTLALQDRTVGSVRASATETQQDSGQLFPNAGSSAPYCGGWYSRTTTTTKFVVRYKVSSPLRAFMSQSGFTNPISLGWELLPFSFVVDWFLPIGSYLESIDSWGGLEFLDGCETNFSRCETGYVRSYYGQSWPDGALHSTSIWTQRGSLYTYGILLNRAKLTALPNKRVPQLKNPLSLTHALNGIALMRTLFK
jgi:hypothetical protein